MDQFWVVTLFHFQPSEEDRLSLESMALEDFSAMGIEEFSLSEEEVDSILGDRSYSGGDLPQEVLDEVEGKVLSGPVNLRFFFAEETQATSFQESVSKKFLCEAQVEKHESQDWNAEWKKHYRPIRVNELFEIL